MYFVVIIVFSVLTWSFGLNIFKFAKFCWLFIKYVYYYFSGTIVIEDMQTPPMQVFNYLLSNEKDYKMEVYGMVPIMDINSSVCFWIYLFLKFC